MSNSIETILKEKIIELSDYLKSKCNNDDQIKLIEEKLNNLKLYEIMMFVLFLKDDQIDNYINQFIHTYKIDDNNETREKIKEYLLYFLNVKILLNENEKDKAL